MRALLLAAGIGSRLRPLTDTVPKCLVPIHGRPLLDYWLDLVFAAGLERTLLNTHWHAEEVERHIAASPWHTRVDLAYEAELLGTGGTVVANRAYFGDAPFLLAHADNLTDVDVASFLSAHAARPAGCVMTMLAFRTDDPRSCGILEVDRCNVVRAFHEKVANPPGDLANGAVYIIEPEVVAYMATLRRGFLDISTEVLPAFVGRIAVHETRGYHRDIGNPESLRRAHDEFRPRYSVPRTIHTEPSTGTLTARLASPPLKQ